MAEPLNPDVFALDVISSEYRQQMDEHSRLNGEIEFAERRLERMRADRATARERADSLVETIIKMNGSSRLGERPNE
jgi:hypothetical protein